MTSEIQWLIYNRVMYVKLSGEISLDEMREYNEYAIQLIDEGIAPVHAILDDEDVQKIPMSVNELSNVLRVFRHPGRGWLVAIGNSGRVERMILSLMTQFFRAQFQRFESTKEALDFLREQDETLDWSQADYSVLGERVARR